MQAVTSIVVGIRLFSANVVTVVLVADCAAYHLTLAAEDEWWNPNADHTLVSWVLHLITLSFHWIVMHACPMWALRNPHLVGPHNSARIVACSLLEGAVVVAFAPLLPDREDTRANRLHARCACRRSALRSRDSPLSSARWNRASAGFFTRATPARPCYAAAGRIFLTTAIAQKG